MQRDDMRRKLDIADIGYYGKPLDTLNKEELIGFCHQLAQTIYEYPHKEQTKQDRSLSEE